MCRRYLHSRIEADKEKLFHKFKVPFYNFAGGAILGSAAINLFTEIVVDKKHWWQVVPMVITFLVWGLGGWYCVGLAWEIETMWENIDSEISRRQVKREEVREHLTEKEKNDIYKKWLTKKTKGCSKWEEMERLLTRAIFCTVLGFLVLFLIWIGAAAASFLVQFASRPSLFISPVLPTTN